MALTINTILSSCYHACYTEGVSDEDELVLVTAPISATSEVQSLYSAGIIDWQSAIPATLHSLGCSATEITDAITRRLEAETKSENGTKTHTETAITTNTTTDPDDDRQTTEDDEPNS